MKIETLKSELEKAKKKAAGWNAKVRDLERQILECENMEIVRAVRGMASSPEELRELLDLLQTVKEPSETDKQNKEDKKSES